MVWFGFDTNSLDQTYRQRRRDRQTDRQTDRHSEEERDGEIDGIDCSRSYVSFGARLQYEALHSQHLSGTGLCVTAQNLLRQ